jgi:rRNA maturation endonuclease Nob1
MHTERELAMKCSNCGSDNPDGKKFCGDCGKELEEPTDAVEEDHGRKCSSCGRALTEETNVCPYCGRWVKRSMFG